MTLIIRKEIPADIPRISHVVEQAFLHAEHTQHTEHFIVTALREAGALTLSLVALQEETLIGHVAASPIHVQPIATDTATNTAIGTTSEKDATGWYGIGPVAVHPAYQRQGVGSALMRQLLESLQAMNAQGCALVGDPAYYSRFGFHNTKTFFYPDIPQEYFQVISFNGPIPSGNAQFHKAFEATS